LACLKIKDVMFFSDDLAGGEGGPAGFGFLHEINKSTNVYAPNLIK
jgi:hypothetical protein